MNCQVAHHTADLEALIYGEVLSVSVIEHLRCCRTRINPGHGFVIRATFPSTLTNCEAWSNG